MGVVNFLCLRHKKQYSWFFFSKLILGKTCQNHSIEFCLIRKESVFSIKGMFYRSYKWKHIYHINNFKWFRENSPIKHFTDWHSVKKIFYNFKISRGFLVAMCSKVSIIGRIWSLRLTRRNNQTGNMILQLFMV